jgi:hypothetical protein
MRQKWSLASPLIGAKKNSVMKKISFITLALLIVTNAIVAQQKTVQFGVKGGVNFSTLVDEFGANDYRTGYHAGLFANIPLDKNFHLQPEVVYSEQGAEFPNGKKHYLDYVSFPLMAQYTIKDRFRIETGPRVSYLAKSKVTYATSPESPNQHEEEYFNEVNKGDFAWSAGVGYVTPFGLGIDARYNLSLGDISKIGHLENRLWQVGIFYQLR